MNGTCNNLERVSVYHDGELPDVAAAEVERHLAACDECSAELERHRAMSDRFATVELPKLSNSAKRWLRRAIDDERSAGRLRIVRALTAVAASIFLVTASHVIHQQMSGGDGKPVGTGGGVGTSQVMYVDPIDEVVRAGGNIAKQSKDVPALTPAPTGPSSSFARFMADGLEQHHD